MDIDRLCLGCMKEKPAGTGKCPHCGFNADTYKSSAYYVLPLMTILHGRYLVGKTLGAGGFGVTYIGYDLTLEMPVAIKEFFMRNTMFRDSTVTAAVTMTLRDDREKQLVASNYRKFREEARTLARLNDMPGIVHVYDCFEENQTMYIVMGYMGGPTLKKYVKDKGGSLEWNETVRLVKPVIHSLARLHKNDILHRDISPDNLMFGAEGSLCLIDFGGAKQEYTEKGDQRSSVSLMKAGYSPVEQMTSSGRQGAWTDEYAMAATIYYCLCGNPPTNALERVTGDRYVPIHAKNRKVTPAQEAVIDKALALNPEDRYPDMEAFLEALRQVTENPNLKVSAPRQSGSHADARTVRATMQTTSVKPVKPKKKPILPILILTAVLGAGAIGGARFLLPELTDKQSAADTGDTAAPLEERKSTKRGDALARVDDPAGLMEEQMKKNLLAKAGKFSVKESCDCMFVLVDDLGGQTTKTFANAYYSEHHINQSGILYLIDLENHQQYVLTKGTIATELTDSDIEAIPDAGSDALETDNYYKAFVAMADATAKRMESHNTDTSEAAEQTEAKQTEAKQTEAKQTEAKQTEAKQTEAKQTEAKQTEAEQTEAKQTEANESDTKTTEAPMIADRTYSSEEDGIADWKTVVERWTGVYTYDGVPVSDMTREEMRDTLIPENGTWKDSNQKDLYSVHFYDETDRQAAQFSESSDEEQTVWTWMYWSESDTVNLPDELKALSVPFTAEGVRSYLGITDGMLQWLKTYGTYKAGDAGDTWTYSASSPDISMSYLEGESGNTVMSLSGNKSQGSSNLYISVNAKHSASFYFNCYRGQ